VTKKASNVIDLMSVLQESLSHTKGVKFKASAPKARTKTKATRVKHKKAA